LLFIGTINKFFNPINNLVFSEFYFGEDVINLNPYKDFVINKEGIPVVMGSLETSTHGRLPNPGA
jgi:hypothetical protein